jgi:hypothetical protein
VSNAITRNNAIMPPIISKIVIKIAIVSFLKVGGCISFNVNYSLPIIGANAE